MAKAEGKKFNFEATDKIRYDVIETFEYDGKPQKIVIEYPEFSAVCPFSGLPDLGTVIITYYPDGRCVELKSLKYYFISFRNVGIYQEKALDIMFTDLKKALQPKYICVELAYNVRGGMEVFNKMESGTSPE